MLTEEIELPLQQDASFPKLNLIHTMQSQNVHAANQLCSYVQSSKREQAKVMLLGSHRVRKNLELFHERSSGDLIPFLVTHEYMAG